LFDKGNSTVIKIAIMPLKLISTIVLIFSIMNGKAQTKTTAFNEPPAWSKSAIWYQIFVERFNNGDTKNDPGLTNIQVPGQAEAPKDWSVTPWTTNWYGQQEWERNMQKPFNETIQYRRYGGDLQGIINKLDYLQNLGITALFINPINDAPSLHKYDARNYHHIDVNFGPDPVGDNKIIAAENPADPSSWKWTSADKLFLQLVKDVHQRKMKIIIDYSWNHTGTLFWAWQDILKKQQASSYKDWYDITSFNDSTTLENEFTYKGWLGIQSLPEIKKTSIATARQTGYSYEGNINEGARQHIFAVTKRWLAPDGDITHGVDGYRLDVADQVGLAFWRDFRKEVRAVNPNAYLIGEIWWEEWPDKLMNPAPYTKGDIFDAVMFYQAYRPARYFFAKTDFEIDAMQLKDSLVFQWNRLKESNRYAMMNVSSSHDAPRLLTDFYNPNKYKFRATPHDDPGYRTGKPDTATFKRLRLYLVHLFTSIGAPQIWNGEEMGMWGADDPHCRKPLWWKELTFENETRNNYQPGIKTFDQVGFDQQQFDWYKKLIGIRKANPVLSLGKIKFLVADGKKFGYKRYDTKQEIIVLFNLEPGNQMLDLPAPGVYIDLLTNKEMKGKTVSMKTLTAAVLKRIH